MGESFELADVKWNEVDRAGTQGVALHVLVPLEDGGRTQVSLTRIAEGGRYDSHVDEYAQVFCVLDGDGEGEVNGERIRLEPGVVMRTNAGDPNGLWAAADRPLVVLTANTYTQP
jgi:quercetin dioxygenase-like cupin family protein